MTFGYKPPTLDLKLDDIHSFVLFEPSAPIYGYIPLHVPTDFAEDPEKEDSPGISSIRGSALPTCLEWKYPRD